MSLFENPTSEDAKPNEPSKPVVDRLKNYNASLLKHDSSPSTKIHSYTQR